MYYITILSRRMTALAFFTNYVRTLVRIKDSIRHWFIITGRRAPFRYQSLHAPPNPKSPVSVTTSRRRVYGYSLLLLCVQNETPKYPESVHAHDLHGFVGCTPFFEPLPYILYKVNTSCLIIEIFDDYVMYDRCVEFYIMYAAAFNTRVNYNHAYCCCSYR